MERPLRKRLDIQPGPVQNATDYSVYIGPHLARTRNETLARQRREEILAAAAGVFQRKGFHATRTEEICAAAEVSPGTLFRHFKDKDEIIAAVVETQTAVYVRLVETAFSAEGMRALLEMDAPTLARYLAPEAGGLSSESWLELARNPALHPFAREADKRIRKAIASGVRAAQAAGVVRPTLDAAEAAEMLNALFSGLMFDQEISPDRDLKPVARALAGLLRRYLLDEAPTARRGR